MTRNRRPDINIDLLIQDYLSGLSTKRVGEMHNCSDTKVSKELKKAGIPRRGKKLLSDKDYEIKEKYEKGESIQNLSDEYGVDDLVIWRKLKSLNVDTSRKIYKSKENFFESLNSPESAYWYGWILADGCIYLNRVSLKITDKEIIENFKKHLEFEGPICNYFPPKRKQNFQVRITSKKMVLDLAKHGCPQNKTFTAQPPIFLQKEFVPYFIRGFFEGDGCAYVNPKNSAVVSFNGNSQVILWVKDLLEKECHVRFRLVQKKNHIEIYCGGNKQVRRIRDFLYNKDSKIDGLFLARKLNKLNKIG
jgi:hypothetical protein